MGERLEERIALDRGPIPDGAGGAFTCPDTLLETRLSAALRAARLPAAEVPGIDIAKGAEATLLAYRRLGGEIAAWLGALPSPSRPPTMAEREEERRRLIRNGGSGAQPADGARLAQEDWLPLVLSLIIESLILALSLLKGRSALIGPRGHLDGRPELPEDYLGRLFEGLSGRRLASFRRLMDYQFRDGPDL